MARCLCVLFTTTSLLASGLHAADANAAQPGAAGLPGPIDVLTVKPAKIAPAVLMPGAQVPEAPAPIDAAARADWLAGQAIAASAGGEAATAPAFETLVLSPAALSVAERAHLILTKPLSVHPAATVEFAADPGGAEGGAEGGMAGGMAGVRLRVRAGDIYLLDFAVSALGPGGYILAADSGQRHFADAEGALRHLLIGLKAESDGWTTVRLRRSGAGFHLHSVEITGAR